MFVSTEVLLTLKTTEKEDPSQHNENINQIIKIWQIKIDTLSEVAYMSIGTVCT